MYYQEWKNQINIILENNLALGCDCLVDIDYGTYFESGYSPLETAQAVADAEWGDRAPQIREI